jgi:hypothetical protein
VTNGGFRCGTLAQGRRACEAGEARMRDALVTFS